VSDEAPELYQLVGAALRDVAQARFMADSFSKQISFVYESDSVLRFFPVPRVDIDEAELTLYFQIKEVALDPARHTLRNSAIGSLFDQYSVRIVRETMQKVREVAGDVVSMQSTDAQTREQIEAFQKRFLSDENRELLSGRLLQYFNESVDKLVDANCKLDVKKVMEDLDGDINKTVFAQPTVIELQRHFQPNVWDAYVQKARALCNALVTELGGEIEKLKNKYPDYRIAIDPSAAAQAPAGAPISSIRIKSSVRNYKWSKVDVDETELRNVRTLTPE
jgi:hypothetical protein